MLAETFLHRGGQADTLFRRLFVDDVICFPNLYLEAARPLPLSAYTCKSEPEFRSDKRRFGALAPHGMWDLLFEDQAGFANQSNRRCLEHTCANAPLKPHEGFYDGGNPTPKTIRGTSLLRMRTAVRTETQSALDASLHSQQELPAGTKFRGLLTTTDDRALGNLQNVLGSLITGYTGRRRAGRVTLDFSSLSFAEPRATFLPWPQQEGWSFFTFTLFSDAILVDRLLRPAITLTVELLKDKQQIGFPEDVSVCIEKVFCADSSSLGLA